MRFAQLYSLITEADDFSDLPKEIGWGAGFWAFPTGEYRVVDMGGHSWEAYTIVKESYRDEYDAIFSKLFVPIEGESTKEQNRRFFREKEKGNIIREEDFLKFKGFVRASIDDGGVYAGGYRGYVSPKALKTTKDIAAFYDKELHMGYSEPLNAFTRTETNEIL